MKSPIKYSIVVLCMFMGHSYGQSLNLKGKKPFEISGSLSFNTQFYAVNGIENRRQPFTWYLNGTPTIKLYGISIPFSFTVSEQERSFSQPFNRYGASPTYKWIKLHAGYRSVRFSDFTLGSANFLGGGIELTPKKLRLGFVYGEFKRRVFEDSLKDNARYSYIRPTYQRLGFGGKIGYGSSRSFLDISFFKAEDVQKSIYTPSVRSGVKPMENLSLGIKTRFGFFKNKLAFDADIAGSALTYDTRLNDLDLSDRRLKPVSGLLTLNSTTTYFKAVKTSGMYRARKSNFRLDYQRIDPGYLSLGSYFFQNDIEQITFSPAASLLKNKISFTGSLGMSRDNLNKKKSMTTYRKVGSLNLMIRPDQNLSIGLGYTNFGVSSGRGLADSFNDSLSVSVINSSLTGNLTQSFGSKFRRQSIGLNLSTQNTNDYSQFSSAVSGTSSLVSSLNYSLSIPAEKLSASGSLSYISLQMMNRNMRNIGPAFTIAKTWKNGLLRTSLNHNSQFRTTNQQNDGAMSNTGIQVNMIKKMHSVGINLNYLFNQYKAQSDGVNFRNFSEYRTNLSYGIRF